MRVSALTSWLLKHGLTLPTPVLRFLSGGGVIHNQGRTLDPQIQFLWRGPFPYRAGGEHLSLTRAHIETARDEWQRLVTLLGMPDDVRVQVETITAEASCLGGLLIRPPHVSEDAPLLVFFHQGGGVMGGPDLNKAFCALLAQEAHCPVFLPQYRLAPLHRFPAALEDARAAYDWAQANSARLGATSGRTAIGGSLIGAGLAARISLDLNREGQTMPAGQLLITPLIDLADTAMRTHAGQGLWPLTMADLDIIIAHYAGAGTDLTHSRLSPAREDRLEGQPKSFIVSAGLDPLAMQGENFARRLIAAQIPTLYRRYDSLPLGFDLFAGAVFEVRTAAKNIADTWMDLLRNGPAA